MIKVLLVDDDPFVLRVYQRGLAQQGMEVELAGGGLAAIKALRQSKPNIVVLDVMMPNFSGIEVLKFIRAQADLADLPVVILSNAYMDDLAREAAAIGAQKALIKVECKPMLLAECIRELLKEAPSSSERSQPVVTPTSRAPAPKPSVPPVAGPAAVPVTPPASPASGAESSSVKEHTREDFLKHAGASRAAIRESFQAFSEARIDKERTTRLEALYRKIHFLGASAGLAGSHLLAQAASAFEAMLFQMMDKPERLSASVMRTTRLAIEFLEYLLQQPGSAQAALLSGAQVLVVDDDALSNRLVVSALRQARLEAHSTQDPLSGLHLLQQRHYDLVLLDLGLPGIDGFEFYKRLRAFPGYKDTPVIYVTALVDFETSAQGPLPGGEDVIAKPVLPSELAVKAVMHLAKSRLEAKSAATQPAPP